MTNNIILPNLLAVTGAAVPPVETVLEQAKKIVRSRVEVDGRVSAREVEKEQTATHGLAWLATYVESLRQMQKWAEKLHADGKFGEIEQLIHQIAFGEYLMQIGGGIQMSQNETVRLHDLGLAGEALAALQTAEIGALMTSGNSQ